MVSSQGLIHSRPCCTELSADQGACRRAQASLEIEAKFRVDDRQIFDQLLALATLGDATLTPQPGPELQHTTYYDTPAETLRARRFSLRVREVAGRRTATVKRSHGAASGLHVRDEWETPVGAEVHPHFWPPGVARERALALLSGEPLLPQCSVHTLRHSILVHRHGCLVAELCLDEGHVRAGGQVAGFRELEVELQGAGTGDDLGQLCAWLTARFVLTPEPMGKRKRGLALRTAAAAL